MKRYRIALVAGGSIILILLLMLGIGAYIAQSRWLREKVRIAIVSELETATGGRVELGAFRFDWKTLTAEVDRLAIHGKESAEQAPLLFVDRIRIGLKIISLLRRDIDVSSIGAEHPQIHLIQYADGTNNVPAPKLRRASNKSPVETILDLKIRSFDLRNGLLLAEAPGDNKRRVPFSTKAENIAAKVGYDPLPARYSMEIAVDPLYFDSKETGKLKLQLQAAAAVERNRLTVSKAFVATATSEVNITNGVLDDFTNPNIAADIAARVSIAELGGILHLQSAQSGIATLTGSGKYVGPKDYTLQGKLHSDNFQFRTLTKSFVLKQARIDSDFVLSPDKVDLEGIRIAAFGGTINGRGGIRDGDRLTAKGTAKGLALRSLLATFTPYVPPYDALVEAPFEVSTSFANSRKTVASAKATLSKRSETNPISGFVDLKYDGAADALIFGPSTVNLPHSRVDVSGVLNRHLDLKASTTQLDDILPFLDRKSLPVTLKNGAATFQGTVNGNLLSPTVDGHVDARNLVYETELLESISTDLKLTESSVVATNARATRAGFTAVGQGTLALSKWVATDASAVTANVRLDQADLSRLFALLKQTDAPVTGTLNAAATVAGTLAAPRITADLKAVQGTISGEPFDAIVAHVDSPTNQIQKANGTLLAGTKSFAFTAGFDHAAATLLPGNLIFQINSNRIALAQIVRLHKDYPDINAFATLKTNGAVNISEDNTPLKALHYRFSKLDGDLEIANLDVAGRALGNARITATTQNNAMTVHVVSDVAQADIRGDATIQLSGDYPIHSRIAIGKVDLATAYKLANTTTAKGSLNFAGSTEAVVTLNGPLAKRDQLTGSIEIPRLELRPIPNGNTNATLKSFVFKNAGTLRASLAKNIVRLDEVRFDAPNTNLSLTGTLGLEQGAPLDVRGQGDVNLAILDGFNRDLTATGNLALNASLRGTLASPDFSGRAELKNGDFHLLDFSNGLTNSNGVIVFNGSRATIQSLSAESGGGKVDATGFLTINNGLLAFNLESKASQVRVRYPQGVSTVADANITIAGTSQRSQATGQVRIRRLTINPKSGAGDILSRSVEPVRTPSASDGLLSNLNLDIQIETSPDVAFQTSLAETLQAEASLRLRGTATNPGLLGRVTVTEGEIVFFGNKYTVTQGTVSFFNPVKVEPVLNVDLETKARGVQIIITVSGPIDKPLNVTYRSDPPLQFSDIVALLATGRSPTDPSIALRDNSGNQSLQQLGASALLGQAIANPVSGRLQRFFGVSKLKIDPQLSGITGSPQARLTIEQQVTPDLLFTYITDVSSTSTQLIRVEYSFDKTWSGILTREENGYVGLDVRYRKSFK